jgi:hypothetical protein
MRKDMFKVIVERPRAGDKARARKGRVCALEDDDGEPIRARRGGQAPKTNKVQETKYLNENLAPLKRFIGKQVGRSWNKVFAEICENLKTSSTVQQHVRDHVEDFVAVKTRMADGKVRTAHARFRGGDVALEDEWRPFFVHPKSGLLKRNPHYRSWSRKQGEARAAKAAERAQRLRVIDSKTALVKLKDDVWWEVKLARMGDGSEPDVVRAAGLSELDPEELYGRAGVRARAKRVLSKAEKKQHKLD